MLAREAVVKVLHHRLRASEVVLQRFMREARLASRLDHPYAAHVYAFGVEPDDGLAWIAMELVHGTSLERWLSERGPLPLEVLVPFFEQVAEVVQNAHDHGIVHRDLKPSNVMLIEYAGRMLPKLLDFGIAKLVDDTVQIATPERHRELDDPVLASADASSVHLTQADATLGSPPYMSPEQWCDPLSVGPRSDLYSLAVMAYEALTGNQPFTGPTIAAIGEQHCNAAVPPVGDGFPAALDRVFQRALAKDPSDRPASALAFASELRAAALPRLDGDASGIRAAAMSRPVFARGRRLWPLTAGAAVLVAGGLAAHTLIARASDDGAPALPRIAAASGRQPTPPVPPPPQAAAAPAATIAEVRPAAPAPASAAATVVVEIASTPPGAEVFRIPSETKVGSTPWRAELPSEAGTQVFLVKKPGFVQRLVEIDLRTGGTRAVALPRAVHRAPPARSGVAPARREGEPVDPFSTPGGS